jgi:hypothetical protein
MPSKSFIGSSATSIDVSDATRRFPRNLTATQADVERAETLLNRDGLSPVEDDSGHRGGACQSRHFPSGSDAPVDSAPNPELFVAFLGCLAA